MENLHNPRPEHIELNNKLIELLRALVKLKNATYIDVFPVDPDHPQKGYTLEISENQPK